MLLGSSMFILAIVTASVVYASPTEIRLNKWFFHRDMFFLALAVALLAYATKYRQTLDMFMSVLFISLYVAYVVIVVLQDYLFRRSRSKDDLWSGGTLLTGDVKASTASLQPSV